MAKQTPNQDQFLLQQNFSHLIFYAFVTIPNQDCKKPWVQLFTNFATKAKKANPPNLAQPKPNQDQFLLRPYFSHLIFDAFVKIHYQDCTKTITSLIHQFCYHGKQSQSTEIGKAKTQPRSVAFATKLLTPHVLCICGNSPLRLHKNKNFTYSPILHHGKKSQSTELG